MLIHRKPGALVCGRLTNKQIAITSVFSTKLVRHNVIRLFSKQYPPYKANEAQSISCKPIKQL